MAPTNCWRIGEPYDWRQKRATSGGITLEAPEVNPHANAPDKKHHAFHARSSNRISIGVISV